MYLNSHAGVLGVGRDLGWREFSLVVCQLLRGRESTAQLTVHQQHSKASRLAIGSPKPHVSTSRRSLRLEPHRELQFCAVVPSLRTSVSLKRHNVPSGSARRPAGEISGRAQRRECVCS